MSEPQSELKEDVRAPRSVPDDDAENRSQKMDVGKGAILRVRD